MLVYGRIIVGERVILFCAPPAVEIAADGYRSWIPKDGELETFVVEGALGIFNTLP